MTFENLKYALVTPARNEARFIEQTIQSVVAQTILPVIWVVVSDGSTDETDEIVGRYLKNHPWIQLVRMPERRERHFGAKVQAFNAGFARVKLYDYDIVGNLDADTTFGPDYFAFILQKFAEDAGLGVAGTPFIEDNQVYDYRFTNVEHVSGCCQLFRKQCFEDIQGYVPLRGGGIDWLAVTTARMKGWKTKTFTGTVCYHRRGMGTAEKNKLHALFAHGAKDYRLGGHPLWQLFRSFYQTSRKPYVIGGLMLLSGYAWSAMKGVKREVSPELMRFHRREQIQRLRRAFGMGSARGSAAVS